MKWKSRHYLNKTSKTIEYQIGSKPFYNIVSKGKTGETSIEKLLSLNHEDTPKAWRESIQGLNNRRSTLQQLGPTLVEKCRKYGLV